MVLTTIPLEEVTWFAAYTHADQPSVVAVQRAAMW